MTGRTKRLARLIAAVVFVLPAILGSLVTSSSAAPSKADVEAARAKLHDLGERLEIVIEQYNEARVRLGSIEDKLAAALADKRKADAEAGIATDALETRAVAAYTGASDQLDVLLGADNFTEFSDRLEFMGALAQNDADLATTAANARQRAEWAAQQYGQALEEQKAELGQMSDRRDEIESMLDQQQELYEQTNQDYQDYQAYLERQRAAAAAAAAQVEQDLDEGSTGTPPPTSDGNDDPGDWTAPPPPPAGSGASAAIAAARSVIGAPYVWGSADPNVGFDCSGLTSWAWAQGGVSLPHSSLSQASAGAVVPSLSQALPGDLLFFYSPISHVALYAGGGQMIHARHPGPGGQVQQGSVAGYGTPVVHIVRPG